MPVFHAHDGVGKLSGISAHQRSQPILANHGLGNDRLDRHGWLIGFALTEPGNNRFFYLAGGVGIAMALYSLSAAYAAEGCQSRRRVWTRRGEAASRPVFSGVRRLRLLISIPFGSQTAPGPMPLEETDCPYPTALQTFCEFSSVVVLTVMPWCIGPNSGFAMC